MSKSYIYAVGILLALSIYMLSGLIGCSRGTNSAPDDMVIADSAGRQTMTVRVREVTAVEIPREVVVPGHTAPARAVDVRAEIGGRVEAVEAPRGSTMEEGAIILRLAANERPERLEETRALVGQRELEFDAAQRLVERSMQSENALAEALANLRAAQQQLRTAELELAHLEPRAPFKGILQDRFVEIGDFVAEGTVIARFIETDPLIVVGEVRESDIPVVHEGEHGYAVLSTGESLEGVIRYVAAEAHPQTRTFTVELEVANPGYRIPAGVSATIRIETERVLAHRISPALISIADDGRFGIKYVDADNIVRFVEADIVRSTPELLWLTGLPETLRLITVGQGFTEEGDLVAVEIDTSAWN